MKKILVAAFLVVVAVSAFAQHSRFDVPVTFYKPVNFKVAPQIGGVSVTINNLATLEAGASGTAGTYKLWPTTALKGYTTIDMADNTGDTTTNLHFAEQGGARIYTIPDAGASSSFVFLAGAQTFTGAKTFADIITTGVVTMEGQIALGQATFTPAAGGANETRVAIVLKDGGGTAMTRPLIANVWLSDAATGYDLTGTAASGTVGVYSTTGALIHEDVAKKAYRVMTKADGTVTLTITDTGKTGYYVCVQVGDKVFVSAQLITGDYGT